MDTASTETDPRIDIASSSRNVTCVSCLLFTIAGFELLNVESPVGRIHFLYLIFAGAALSLRNYLGTASVCIAMFSLLLASFLPSIAFSTWPSRSVALFARVLLSYFCIAVPIAQLARTNYPATIAGLVWAFRLQIIAAAVVFYVGLQPASATDYGNTRAHLLFYEPSYMAIAIAPYLVCVLLRILLPDDNLFGQFWILFDLVLILVLMWITKSAMLMLAIALALALTLFIIRHASASGLTQLAILLLIGVVACGTIVQNLSDDDLIRTTYNGWVESDSKFDYLLERSQNRYPRIIAASTVFKENLLTGVGFGCYERYSGFITLSQFSPHIVRSNVHDMPAVNIFLEVAAESGVTGLLGIIAFFYVIINRSRVAAIKLSTCVLHEGLCLLYLPWLSLLQMLLLLLIESNPFRPYLWTIIGLNVGIAVVARDRGKVLGGTHWPVELDAQNKVNNSLEDASQRQVETADFFELPASRSTDAEENDAFFSLDFRLGTKAKTHPDRSNLLTTQANKDRSTSNLPHRQFPSDSSVNQ